jgi:succinyl-diaminopimelate desuccinylase
VRIDGNAPPGPVTVRNPLVDRLRAAGDLAVGPKQAWTPVAEFAAGGVDAVNFGPGDPQYAHRDDERIEVDALVRCRDVMRRFLGLHDSGATDGRREAAS